MGPRSFGPAAIMLALAAAVLFAAPATSAQQPREPRARILVGFDPGVSVAAQRASLERADATANGRLRRIRAFVVSVPASDRRRALAELRRDPRVRFAEPDAVYRIDTLPNDPRYHQLCGMNNTGQTGGNRGRRHRRPAGLDHVHGIRKRARRRHRHGRRLQPPRPRGEHLANPGEIPGSNGDRRRRTTASSTTSTAGTSSTTTTTRSTTTATARTSPGRSAPSATTASASRA